LRHGICAAILTLKLFSDWFREVPHNMKLTRAANYAVGVLIYLASAAPGKYTGRYPVHTVWPEEGEPWN
jgi:hypothetical protein